MIRSMTMLAACLLAVGCGYSEDTYAEDFTDAWCDKSTECESDILAFYVSLGSDEATAQTSFDTAYDALCNAEATEAEDGEDECEFDSAAAKECVEAIETATCEESATGFEFPSACNNVCG